MINHPHDDVIQHYFSNRDNCIRDLGMARKCFTDKTTTEPQYDQMEKTLALMFLYCPEDVQGIVEATMFEAEQRRFYFIMGWALTEEE